MIQCREEVSVMKRRKWSMAAAWLITLSLAGGGCGRKEQEEVLPAAQETEADAQPAEAADGPEGMKETDAAKSEMAGSRAEGADDGLREHFNEVVIEGTAFSIPISYKELEEMGFHLDSAQKDVTSGGSPVTGYCSWGEDQKGIFCMDFRFKGKGDGIPLTGCDAVSFVWDADSAGGIEVSFYGGLREGSTRAEAAAFLDEVYADESGAQYMAKLDENGYAKLAAYFDGDRLVMVELFNYADYVD